MKNRKLKTWVKFTPLIALVVWLAFKAICSYLFGFEPIAGN